MKISELIAILQSLPPDMPVYMGKHSSVTDLIPSQHLLIGTIGNNEYWESLIIPDYEFPKNAVSTIEEFQSGQYASRVINYVPPAKDWDTE